MKSHPIECCLKWLVSALGALTLTATAAPPVVKTVPWDPNNPLQPHFTYVGKTVSLKGTCDRQGADLLWTWDFGDGSPAASGTVSNAYVIEASHAYSGALGTVYQARLTVQDTSTSEVASADYLVRMWEKELKTEVNIAIDEGLWYLHKNQTRYLNGGVACGDWRTLSSYYGIIATNVNAFEVQGHVEDGNPSNPYTETVQRGMHAILQTLTTRPLGLQALGNPDTNGNGYGVCLNQNYQYYQGGMIMDAIIAGDRPNAVAATGQAPSGGNPGILGRTYRDIIQDMVDDHAWAQYDDARYGGWRYSAQDFPDNSACQWAAIGLLAAERNWLCTIPAWVKSSNVNWLAYTQTPGWSGSGGKFGYTDEGYYPWGPYASTPSGMVQMAFNGIGRGMTGPGGVPNWDMTETFLRNNFGNTGGPTSAIKDYYYGLLSFVKAMVYHPSAPIEKLRSQTSGVAELDWYGAETAKGDPTNGVARTLVNDQGANGRWWGNDYSGDQYPFETGWAIMMLKRSVGEIPPVAVAKAVPNPAVAGQPITLDGSDSYHPVAGRNVDSWQWDVNNDGVYDLSGPIVETSFAAVGVYPVKLRVTDDGSPELEDVAEINVLVTIPPVAPTADANGPYVFCAESKPWFLDGRMSANPDEGGSEPHDPPYPGDTIQEYAWDLDGDNDFNDAFGPTPNVTAYFEASGPGAYLVSLRVTDTTATSYPSSQSGDLSHIAIAEVRVADGPCGCVQLSGEALVKDVLLTWTDLEADHFNVYRSTVSGGPYVWIGTTARDEPMFLDHPGILNQIYYYVVRPARLNGDEICQSNEVAVEPLHPVPTVACTPIVMSNPGKYYYMLEAASQCFGRHQLTIYIGDTASPQVAGPFARGKKVYIRTGLAAPSIKPGRGEIETYVMTKGQARVWAEDPIGQKSVEILIP